MTKQTIDGLTRRQILTIGTTKGVQSLTDAHMMNTRVCVIISAKGM